MRPGRRLARSPRARSTHPADAAQSRGAGAASIASTPCSPSCARPRARPDPRGRRARSSPLVRRVVANNPGLMTGPGTNTYLVGIDEVAVIDPGPDLTRHVDAIIGASMRERVRWVLLTHTHPDHWPAAAKIREDRPAR